MNKLESANILIVEDEKIVAWDIKERLQTLGYQVVANVTSGEAAIVSLAQTKPDLVLMDIQLPGQLNGIETAQIIYDQYNIPVVYLTAHSDETTLEAATQTNPFGYLLKPFQVRELHSTIQIALRRHEREMLAITQQEIIQLELLQHNQDLEKFQLNLISQISDKTSQFEKLTAYMQVLVQLLDEKTVPKSASQRLNWILKQLSDLLKYDYAWIAIYNEAQTSAAILYEYRSEAQLDLHQMPTITDKTINIADFPDFYQLLFLGVSWIDPPRSMLPTNYTDLLQSGGHLLICPLFTKQVAGKPPVLFGEVGIMVKGNPPWEDSVQVKLITQMVSYAASLSRQAELSAIMQAQKVDLESLNYLKEDFISSVSHELKMPLDNMNRAIKIIHNLIQTLDPLASGSSQFHHDQNNVKHRLMIYLQSLEADWQLEYNFVNDLLHFNASAMDIEPMHLNFFEVQPCCAEVVEEFSEQIQRFNLIFTSDFQPQRTMLYSHRASVKRIVKELINNAIKYTPPNCQICLISTSTRETIELRVINTGITIPEAELESIFKPFYRIPRSNPWDYCGTGLGLALIRKLAGRLGGTIEAKSGHNVTTFVLQLPNLIED
jgi:signal transduction histidine kinase/CheY-like chemotaxis protein